MAQHYKIISQSDRGECEKELLVEIAAEYIDSFAEKSLVDFAKEVEIDGFRKGKAPANLVKERVGEFRIFEESVQRAVQQVIPVILAEEKLDAITMPHVHMKKLAPGQPAEFMMHFYTMPEVELPDYKKVAKDIKKEDAELKSEEVEGYIEQILSSRATKNEAGEDVKSELTDDFVKTLGNFKDVEDFKKQLTENMKQDKDMQVAQKRRLEIMEKIIEETKMKMPDVLIEEEQHKMLDEFRGRVESMKMNFEEYLATIKKTEDELKTEWKDDAAKRAKMNIILPNIASKEDLKPNPDAIEAEIKNLKAHHPDIDESRARVYIAGILTNEEVFKFLETL
jgi:FKBP-type peptidyl-prolyl cis-trans isomerase (trigger factor)